MSLLLLALLAAAQDDSQAQVDLLVEREDWVVPGDLKIRARVTSIIPEEPSTISWRYGGEGLGGNVVRGTFGENLSVGAWSPYIAVSSFGGKRFPRVRFLTVTAGRPGRSERVSKEDPGRRRKVGFSTDVEFQFELAAGSRTLKKWTARGPHGGTVGLVIPAERLSGGKTPDDPAFLDGVTDLLTYARSRAEAVERLPWAKGRRPEKFALMTTLGGFGEGSGYGVRYTDPEVAEAECRVLRALGVNGFVNAPPFALEAIRKDGTYDGSFGRAVYRQLGGYPVPRARKGRKNDPESGCPYAPGVEERMAEIVRTGLAEAQAFSVDEVWWRTEDEIGAVVDRSEEGKAHLSRCDRCAGGFREYLKGQGVSPKDLGMTGWAEVRPLDIWKKGADRWAEDSGTALLAYHTARFNNHASAKLFGPLRKALVEAKKDLPRVYSFALRGNTFLMRGHSLDFFNYYRLADNAFVYETSNRDARIWGWDSYLCDVGRVVSRDQGLRFGVYVKPHRGAPIQRMLAAASRGATMIYWYTYGPDYTKGDSFSSRPDVLASTVKAAWLLGRAEKALYGAEPLVPAEVAVVKPRSSEIWRRLSGRSAADWENAKWIYTALTHAHVPVDPVDEVMLARSDLSRYKVIYVNGPNLTRAAAEKLEAWVRAGGTLVTSGGGAARDEAERPLSGLQAVLGLERRGAVEERLTFKGYGASRLQVFPPQESDFPQVGREALHPVPGAKILARFGDRTPSLVRNPVGKGAAVVDATFPGLEYSMKVRVEVFDMSRDFNEELRKRIAGPAVDRVTPPATASHPLVEVRLLRNPETGVRSVVLMNWAYRVIGKRIRGKRVSTVKSLVPLENVTVRLRGIEDVSALRSAVLGRALEFRIEAGELVATLPKLDEGDVLILE